MRVMFLLFMLMFIAAETFALPSETALPEASATPEPTPSAEPAPPVVTKPEAIPDPSGTPTPEPTPVAETPAPSHASQFNWQPEQSRGAVTFGVGYSYSRKIEKLNGVEARMEDRSGTRISLTAEYGLTEAAAIEVSLALANRSLKELPNGGSVRESKFSGGEDLYLKSKNFFSLSGHRLYFGLGVGWSPARHREPSAASNYSDGNNYSGGVSIPFHVALESPADGGWWGVRIDADVKLDRASDTDVGEVTTSGGQSASIRAYIEKTQEIFWNAYVGYRTTTESSHKNILGAIVSTEKPATAVLFGAGAGSKISPTVQLNLSYGGEYSLRQSRGAGLETDPYISHLVTAQARFEF